VGFDEAQAAFMNKHLANRKGERLARLERGYRHPESLFLRNVWWPVQGDLKDLHPEYEVSDWRGRSYFADFVWLPGHIKLLIEIKGFATHVRDMDRQKYCNELNREAFLCAMGYQVISFAYDDVEQRPDLCITLLRMVLSRYQPASTPITRALLAEKEVIRLALGQPRPLRPKDVEHHFQVDHKTAVQLLRGLCTKGYLIPICGSGQQRVVRYELARGVLGYLD
jgi:very-short-patch-repair endonuclease